MLTTFSENVIVEGIRVYPPKKFVLLCGGEVGTIRDDKPKSLRDALLREGDIPALKDSEFLQVEEVQDFFDKTAPYKSLVSFESDLAQVCELVLLFPESPGSFAELGSFTRDGEISENLLVAIQSRFLVESSFIAKGPIESLSEYQYSVFSYDDATVGIKGENKTDVDGAALARMLASPIERRLAETISRTSFDPRKFNHQCKIYTGLLRECYSLKDDEVVLFMRELGCTENEVDLDRISFCSKALRWTGTSFSGFDRIHFAHARLNEAARIEFKPPIRDKLRRRAEFRDYWLDVDPDRVAAADRGIIR